MTDAPGNSLNPLSHIFKIHSHIHEWTRNTRSFPWKTFTGNSWGCSFNSMKIPNIPDTVFFQTQE